MHLVLFFTKGVSLKTWADNGSLSREIALYLRLLEKGIKVSFITYGRKTDLQYRNQLGGIQILCNRWNFSSRKYEQLIPLLHAGVLFHATLIKTNQIKGADVALRAARVWHKPLIVRCGYMWSDFAIYSDKQADAERARQLEGEVFSAARRVAVTTPSMKDYIVRNYGLVPSRVQIIPNFVLTDVFIPDGSQPVPNRICFVGRFSEEKNLPALIRACAGLDVDLWLVGEGHLRSNLRALADQVGTRINMPGSVPHYNLPDVIRSAALFVLVSPHEGHPKALLEAMACGSAVLGADSPGIREQIIHGETGWLCGTDPESIRNAVLRLLGDTELRHKLGANARTYIEQNYSLERIVQLERNLLQQALK